MGKAIGELSRKRMQAAMGVNAQEGRLVIANRIKAALCAFSRWCWQRGYTETGVGAGLLKAGIEKARERKPCIINCLKPRN